MLAFALASRAAGASAAVAVAAVVAAAVVACVGELAVGSGAGAGAAGFSNFDDIFEMFGFGDMFGGGGGRSDHRHAGRGFDLAADQASDDGGVIDDHHGDRVVSPRGRHRGGLHVRLSSKYTRIGCMWRLT